MGTESYLSIAVMLLGSALFLFVGLFLVAQDASTRRLKLWNDELERNGKLECEMIDLSFENLKIQSDIQEQLQRNERLESEIKDLQNTVRDKGLEIHDLQDNIESLQEKCSLQGRLLSRVRGVVN